MGQEDDEGSKDIYCTNILGIAQVIPKDIKIGQFPCSVSLN